ncbi:hypothetical protein AB0J21_11050 [Streptomyces sp. NPDC049954]|uniref:hypothetical protein n=1 Tax=Streptomyces sp. NPDC049954 TaxID=3155779 RepID=UPI003415024F
MADRQSNAPSRAETGASTTGVIHVRTRLTADFTVLSNALAQRRGSAVTIGVAAYILSLPDGSPVSISALCAHFSEGEIVISRALRELEAEGYLERPRVRLPSGQIRTRTYFHDVPLRDRAPRPDGPPEPPKPPRPRRSPAPSPRRATTRTALTRVPPPAQPPVPAQREAEEPVSLADADPRAVAVLASLRRVDPRLVLSEREAARLVPGIGRWLAAGLSPHQVTEVLSARLPDHFLARPAAVLAFRLRETPLPAPPPLPTAAPQPPRRPAVQPWQNCDGCERAFRAPEPGHCRDCRSARRFRVVG